MSDDHNTPTAEAINGYLPPLPTLGSPAGKRFYNPMYCRWLEALAQTVGYTAEELYALFQTRG